MRPIALLLRSVEVEHFVAKIDMLTVTDQDIRQRSGGGMGQGSMRQGDVSGAGFMSPSTVIAFDRSGNQLWTYDLGGE